MIYIFIFLKSVICFLIKVIERFFLKSIICFLINVIQRFNVRLINFDLIFRDWSWLILSHKDIAK